jgi:hypothetical protein
MMARSLRCQNPACAKVITPRSRAIPRNVTIGSVTYHQYFCSDTCAAVVARRKVPRTSRLSLVVYKAYFDAIVSGEKTIEYRSASWYWIKRLIDPEGKERQFDEVEFRNGYQKNARRAVFVCKGVKWVGPKFEIHIGERLR